jgi:hypothetical protein
MNENTDHGNCTTAYSRCRHAGPFLRTAPIHAIAPCFRTRRGSGAATSSPSNPRARARSNAPNPRQPARAAASTGMPRKVISSPMPSENIVTANVNMMRPRGRLSIT